jgi:hypothetical protein
MMYLLAPEQNPAKVFLMFGWGWEIKTGIRYLNETRAELPQGSGHGLPTCALSKPSGSFL